MIHIHRDRIITWRPRAGPDRLENRFSSAVAVWFLVYKITRISHVRRGVRRNSFVYIQDESWYTVFHARFMYYHVRGSTNSFLETIWKCPEKKIKVAIGYNVSMLTRFYCVLYDLIKYYLINEICVKLKPYEIILKVLHTKNGWIYKEQTFKFPRTLINEKNILGDPALFPLRGSLITYFPW
jgi:hypothetical protein